MTGSLILAKTSLSRAGQAGFLADSGQGNTAYLGSSSSSSAEGSSRPSEGALPHRAGAGCQAASASRMSSSWRSASSLSAFHQPVHQACTQALMPHALRP